jgi:PBP1b-binding outer membrane lipoprotein LpoB
MHSIFVKRLLFGLFALLLFGCSAQQTTPSAQSDNQPPTEEEPAMPKVASLPDLGPAPELTNDTWLNVDSPLRLADLHGKVVLIDMWTFG